jgi:hypothetical protein
MDMVKRAASRLRRLQSKLAIDHHQWPPRGPFSVRAIRRGRTSLRQIIDDTVVAFVPPFLPISSGNLTCDNALVQFSRDEFGECFWTLNVHVQTFDDNTPTVFVFGFTTKRGYWGGFIGAVNFPGSENSKSDAVSATASATVSGWGVSRWIPANWSAAIQEGVEFRLFADTDLTGTTSDLLGQWLKTFDVTLFRPLNLFDDLDAREYASYEESSGLADNSSLVDDGGDDPGASFEVSLRFE